MLGCPCCCPLGCVFRCVRRLLLLVFHYVVIPYVLYTVYVEVRRVVEIEGEWAKVEEQLVDPFTLKPFRRAGERRPL